MNNTGISEEKKKKDATCLLFSKERVKSAFQGVNSI